MKKIVFVVVTIVLLMSLCFSASANSDLMESVFYEISCLDRADDDIDQSLEVSGVKGLNTNVGAEVTVHCQIVVTEPYEEEQGSNDLVWYMWQELLPEWEKIKSLGFNQKEFLDGKFVVGDKDRQPVDYHTINLIEWRYIDDTRIGFNTLYGYNSVGSKIYKNTRSHALLVEFELEFSVDKMGTPSEFVVHGEDTIYEPASTYVNSYFYFFPVVEMKEFTELYGLSWTYVYFRVESIEVAFDRSPLIYDLVGNSFRPSVVMYTNCMMPFLEGVVNPNRYNYDYDLSAHRRYGIRTGTYSTAKEYDSPRGVFLSESFTTLDLADEVTREHYNINYFCSDFYNTEFQYSFLYYKVSFDTSFSTESTADPVHFSYYMRVNVYDDYRDSDCENKFNTFPITASAWVLYSPKVVIGSVDNIGGNVGGVNVGSLYLPVWADVPDTGDLFDDWLTAFYNVVVYTVPNVIYNFIIWFACESPLIGDIVGPIFLISGHTMGIVEEIVLPLLGFTGVLGIGFAIVLCVKVFVGWIK